MKFYLRGPIHTPYYQAFLCFDLICPETYPIVPPKLTFHARGFRLNPNLYENGHVCLSLLGTWDHHDACERWSPAQSNLLQVLVSIQGLIFVKEPYYNEAGFESLVGTTEGRKNSKMYNEHCFLLRIQHTMSLAANHPPDWTYEFRDHYKKTTPELLRRCRRYLSDAAASSSSAVGSAATANDGKINADGIVLPMTDGFLSSLQQHVVLLQAQYDALVPKWDADEAQFNLPHMD